MWKSSNKIYRYVIGLPIALIIILFTFIFRAQWITVLITISLGILILYALYSKTKCLPYALTKYGTIEPISLELPKDSQADVYYSSSMDSISPNARIAELISPLKFEDNRVKIMINPSLHKKLGSKIFAVAVTREIVKYRIHYQLKIILRLLLPILTVILLFLAALAGNWFDKAAVPSYFISFLLPFISMILFVVHLLTWNRFVSRMDYQLDRLLTSYFSMKDVETYIIAAEDFEKGAEKEQHKSMNEHYRSERIKRLRKAEGV